MLFVGVDWAEAHHDVCVLDEEGAVLGKRRVRRHPGGLGPARSMLVDHLGRRRARGRHRRDREGPWASRDRAGRCWLSSLRGEPDVGFALSRASPALGPSPIPATPRCSPTSCAPTGTTTAARRGQTLADAMKVLARAHQNTIWSRQREVNTLRNALKDYYPGALEAFGTELRAP